MGYWPSLFSQDGAILRVYMDRASAEVKDLRFIKDLLYGFTVNNGARVTSNP